MPVLNRTGGACLAISGDAKPHCRLDPFYDENIPCAQVWT
jgi:hypothetical protein